MYSSPQKGLRFFQTVAVLKREVLKDLLDKKCQTFVHSSFKHVKDFLLFKNIFDRKRCIFRFMSCNLDKNNQSEVLFVLSEIVSRILHNFLRYL